MNHITLFESKTGWSDVSLILRGFSGESFGNEANFIDLSFPSLLLTLTRLEDLKHLTLTQLLHLLDWHLPFPCFLLPSLMFSSLFNTSFA